jgi:hypothetical protein
VRCTSELADGAVPASSATVAARRHWARAVRAHARAWCVCVCACAALPGPAKGSGVWCCCVARAVRCVCCCLGGPCHHCVVRASDSLFACSPGACAVWWVALPHRVIAGRSVDLLRAGHWCCLSSRGHAVKTTHGSTALLPRWARRGAHPASYRPCVVRGCGARSRRTATRLCSPVVCTVCPSSHC